MMYNTILVVILAVLAFVAPVSCRLTEEGIEIVTSLLMLDPKKRPIMGEIATKLSDYVILTSDNPRTEDPQKIMDDIVKGVKTNNYEIELDRKEAIKKAVNMLNKNDILLVLGKGHENYQIIGKTKYHLDDAEEVLKYKRND